MLRPVDRSGIVDRAQPTPAPQWDPRGLPELRLRIEMLRQKARLRAGKVSHAVASVAVLLLIAGIGIVFFLLLQGAMGTNTLKSPWLLGVLIVGAMLAIAYGVYILGGEHSLLERHSSRTLKLLRESSLGIILVHEEYWSELIRQHAKQHPLAPADRPTRATIEEQLAWCAYHFNSMVSCYQRQDTNLSRCFALEQFVHSLDRVYRLPPLMYLGGGCLLLLFMPVSVPLNLVFCWAGLQHVIAQARLVAICDFLLSEGVDPNAAGWD